MEENNLFQDTNTNYFISHDVTNSNIIIIDKYFFNTANDTKLLSLKLIDKFLLKFEKNKNIRHKSFINLNDFYALPFLIMQKLLDSIDNTEFICGRLIINRFLWSKISNDDSEIIFKKFEIYRILTDELNILIESFNKDNYIDEILIDNICKILIETQNIISKISPEIKPSNYMIEKIPLRNQIIIDVPYYLNKKIISSFNSKNNDEYLEMIKQFLKTSIKIESILHSISDDYLEDEDINTVKYLKDLDTIDKKNLITKFYINTVVKMLIYDLRNIIIKFLREEK